MVYRRSHEIETRLEEVLRLIRIGGYATPTLAKALGVSIPTVSRCVTALRERGHEIRAEKKPNGWQYILHNAGVPARKLNRSGPTITRGSLALIAYSATAVRFPGVSP